MRKYTRKLPNGTIILFISMLLVVFSSTLVFTNIRNKDELNRSKRAFYSENAVKMAFEGQSAQEFMAVLSQGDFQDIILYKPLPEINSDTRGVFFRGKIERLPVSSGRFFVESDFFMKKRNAIIGKNFLKDVIVRDSKQFITIFDEEFEVIGILGSSQPTRLDSMKLLPLDTAVFFTGSEGTYYLDCSNKKIAEKNISLLNGILKKDLVFTMSFSDDTEGFGLNLPDTIVQIYLATLISFAMTAILTTINWIEHRGQMIQVERMMGFKTLTIIASIFTRYLIVLAAAGVLSIAMTAVVRWINDAFKPQWADVLIAMAIMLITGIVILAVCLLPRLRTKKMELTR